MNPPLTEARAITVLQDGRMIPEVREMISLIKECYACLATLHLSAEESHAVAREARDEGLRRIILSHARWAITGLTMRDVHELADMGCLIEFEYCLMTAIMYFVHGEARANPIKIIKAMKEIGPERCFIS